MRHVQGDLIVAALKGEIDVLVHGCNCYCKMGAGIAKQIRHAFPQAYAADKDTRAGDRSKLGTVSAATISILTEEGSYEVVVVNAYTQMTYWDKSDMLDYDAVARCFEVIRYWYPDKRIGMPLIGCGLARGSWPKIQQIVDTVLDGIDVTIYHRDPYTTVK